MAIIDYRRIYFIRKSTSRNLNFFIIHQFFVVVVAFYNKINGFDQIMAFLKSRIFVHYRMYFIKLQFHFLFFMVFRSVATIYHQHSILKRLLYPNWNWNWNDKNRIHLHVLSLSSCLMKWNYCLCSKHVFQFIIKFHIRI